MSWNGCDAPIANAKSWSSLFSWAQKWAEESPLPTKTMSPFAPGKAASAVVGRSVTAVTTKEIANIAWGTRPLWCPAHRRN